MLICWLIFFRSHIPQGYLLEVQTLWRIILLSDTRIPLASLRPRENKHTQAETGKFIRVSSPPGCVMAPPHHSIWRWATDMDSSPLLTTALPPLIPLRPPQESGKPSIDVFNIISGPLTTWRHHFSLYLARVMVFSLLLPEEVPFLIAVTKTWQEETSGRKAVNCGSRFVETLSLWWVMEVKTVQ